MKERVRTKGNDVGGLATSASQREQTQNIGEGENLRTSKCKFTKEVRGKGGGGT